MIRTARAAIALALALSLVASQADAFRIPFFGGRDKAPPAPREETRAPTLPAATAWPQAASDIAPDPAVRFGTLPNGMRYALQRSASPPGQASIRLRFDAGSMMETDAQQGLAHFLEHMAFNGSTHVPEGEMVKILERLGLSFGADTNASTSFTQTVYKLDLPNVSDETVDTALMLMRETASELTISQEAVDRERGVVLSEERSSDSPAYRVTKARLAFLLDGQLAPNRMPIGQATILQTATRDQIADYYARYYRPDRAVLIMVGDFDPAVMEAKIQARFADWRPKGNAGPEPNYGTTSQRQTQFKLITQPGAPTAIQLAWVQPPDYSPDSQAKRRRDMVEYLAMQAFNRRLYALSRASDAPFISAGSFKGDQIHSADVTAIYVTARANGWQAALSATEQEARRAAQFGVRQDELDREIAEVRAALEIRAQQAATQRTPTIADELIGTVDPRQVITSNAQDLAIFEAQAKTITAAEVSAALANAFKGAGPLVFMTSPVAIEGGQDALVAAWNTSRQVAVTAPAATATVVWPYEDFGTPGAVAERRDVIDLETSFITFSNGVRLTVKSTNFRDDQVLMRVRVGRGLLGLPSGQQNAFWASDAFIEGGLGKIGRDDLERVLAARVFDSQLRIEDDAFSLSGATRPDDVEAQLQVLAAYVSDPGWRPEAYDRLRNRFATANDQLESTDSGVLSRDLAGLMHAGDRRWTFPTRAEVSAATLQNLRDQIGPDLSTGAIEVVIVGDIQVEKAIDLVAKTFGALPARSSPPPVSEASRQIAFPAGGAPPTVLTHTGRPDQAIGYVAWPTNDLYTNTRGMREVTLLAEVMRLRVLDELRERQGVSYSPNASSYASIVFPGYGYISATVETSPDKVDGFFAAVSKIAAELRTGPVTADELDRARKPLMEGLQRQRQTNEYWLSALGGADRDPRRLDLIRSLFGTLDAITPADIQRAAQAYLRDEKSWRLIVRPAPT